MTTADVARAWLNLLPAGATFTAERAAYRVLLQRARDRFTFGGEPGFDLAECSDNKYNDWIGAQIRADVYGWVCPGQPSLAAELAQRDAALSHRGDGVYGAMFVAALGAALADAKPSDALAQALERFHPTVAPRRPCGWARNSRAMQTAVRRSARATTACRRCTR